MAIFLSFLGRGSLVWRVGLIGPDQLDVPSSLLLRLQLFLLLLFLLVDEGVEPLERIDELTG